MLAVKGVVMNNNASKGGGGAEDEEDEGPSDGADENTAALKVSDQCQANVSLVLIQHKQKVPLVNFTATRALDHSQLHRCATPTTAHQAHSCLGNSGEGGPGPWQSGDQGAGPCSLML